MIELSQTIDVRQDLGNTAAFATGRGRPGEMQAAALAGPAQSSAPANLNGNPYQNMSLLQEFGTIDWPHPNIGGPIWTIPST